MFSQTPVIYAVGDEYQLMVYTSRQAFISVKIGSRVFDDTVCGFMRSEKGMRRIIIPAAVLDKAKSYTLRFEYIAERKSYFTEITETEEKTYSFRPVSAKDKIRFYQAGDVHGRKKAAVKAAKLYGDMDFLLLNGDMEESRKKADFSVAHNFAAEISKGEIPVVYVRGNHENRGALVEQLSDYIPHRNGKTYYTFRLGNIWGLVLDCGEDKVDSHPEYGSSVRFQPFRREETEFIRSVIKNKSAEYAAEGVEHVIVAVHVPFVMSFGEEFDIEEEVYTEWLSLLKKINPELMLSAHIHRYGIFKPGDSLLRFDPPCTVVAGSYNKDGVIGGLGVELSDSGNEIETVKSDGERKRIKL